MILKTAFNAILGIATEILYSFIIMTAALLISAALLLIR